MIHWLWLIVAAVVGYWLGLWDGWRIVKKTLRDG